MCVIGKGRWSRSSVLLDGTGPPSCLCVVPEVGQADERWPPAESAGFSIAWEPSDRIPFLKICNLAVSGQTHTDCRPTANTNLRGPTGLVSQLCVRESPFASHWGPRDLTSLCQHKNECMYIYREIYIYIYIYIHTAFMLVVSR